MIVCRFARDADMNTPLVEVRFHPIRKNHGLGPMKVLHTRPHPGETAFRAASRVLDRRYKVMDYLIVDAELLGGAAVGSFLDS